MEVSEEQVSLVILLYIGFVPQASSLNLSNTARSYAGSNRMKEQIMLDRITVYLSF
jgi:hypothetical protein